MSEFKTTGHSDFAFKSYFGLRPIIDFFQKNCKNSAIGMTLKDRIEKYLIENPFLNEEKIDFDNTKGHEDFIELLANLFFSRADFKKECKAILLPFSNVKIMATDNYHDLKLSKKLDHEEVKFLMEYLAYLKIFKEIFQFEIEFSVDRYVWPGKLSHQNFTAYWQVGISLDFCQVKSLTPITDLTASQKKKILDNLDNLEVWKEVLPPEQFEFNGLMQMQFKEVTTLEILSNIKQRLIDREAITNKQQFVQIQDQIRCLFQNDLLVLSISIIVPLYNHEWEIVRYSEGLDGGIRSIYQSSFHYGKKDFDNSIFCKAMRSGKGSINIIRDLATNVELVGIDHVLLKQGIKNIVIVPLHYEGEKIGFLDITSSIPGQVHFLNAWKFEQLTELFAAAVQRTVNSLKSELDAVIKKNCTVIHPSVEWRFQEAAIRSFAGKDGKSVLMEEIVFNDVYPLFGLSDIRGSSTLRNKAIHADLVTQLNLATNILEAALATNREESSFPYLEEILFRLEKIYQNISEGLNAGDEISIINFFKRDIDPLFKSLNQFSEITDQKIRDYYSRLDPHMHVIYEKRKDFDVSVKELNGALSEYLDRQQVKAQKIYPHYFEKQVTDGVDHNIYIGEALTNSKPFDRVYLNNIRLWQLLIMCGSAALCDSMQSKLPMPLSLAHLIIVQYNPLSISFNYDEKEFGVEGAYNIRYEIVKKRIDKATIKGTGERLTQPGRIAIVYSQDVEREEYMRYIEYLVHRGKLETGTEEVAIEDLQGVHGLRALRVKIVSKDVEDVGKKETRSISLVSNKNKMRKVA